VSWVQKTGDQTRAQGGAGARRQPAPAGAARGLQGGTAGVYPWRAEPPLL